MWCVMACVLCVCVCSVRKCECLRCLDVYVCVCEGVHECGV